MELVHSARAAEAPVCVAVAKNTFARGYNGPGSKARPVYVVKELREALLATYKTDAHLVSYVVRGAAVQPRINKPGLPYFDGVVEIGVFFCDVDNPDHRPWDDELRAAAERQYAELDVLKTAGVYHTKHGRRIVQPLVRLGAPFFNTGPPNVAIRQFLSALPRR
jgi:hypothetical protein